jgi:hypothetical protein
MYAPCECCDLSIRDLCVQPTSRSPTECGVSECDLGTSTAKKKDLDPLRVTSHEEKETHAAKSGYRAGGRGQLIIRSSLTLSKTVTELVAVWSADQSGCTKQHFILSLFKLKNSGRNINCTFLNLLEKGLGSTTGNRPGFTILLALVAHRRPTFMSRLLLWDYLLTSASYLEYLRNRLS